MTDRCMNQPARSIRHADHASFREFLAHLIGCLEINLAKGRADTQADIDNAIGAVLDTHPDVTSTADADQRVEVAAAATAHLCDHQRRMGLAEAEVKRLTAERDADRAEVVALCQERLRLVAERDSLKGLLSGSQQELRDAITAQGRAETERDEARAALDRVRALHRGLRIYDECGHKHDASDPGAKWIDEVGFVCEDGYMYTICGECCRDGDYQSEHCANDHSHTVCHPCPTLAILSGSGT